MSNLSLTQYKMALAGLQLGVRDVAKLAKVAPGTLTRFVNGEELKPRTLDAIKHALEGAGIIFLPEEQDVGEGVRIRKLT